MTDPKELRLHSLMEKFMNFKLIMRRTQKKHMGPQFALIILHSIDHGKPVMASQISQKMEITNAASTQLIDTLVRHGWVSRKQDDQDRRVIWIEMTPLGQDILKATFAQASSYVEALLAYLGEEDAQHMDRILGKMIEFALQSGHPEQ